MSKMKIFWVETESGALIIRRFHQLDGMPLPEDTILGGVNTSNGYSMGWVNLSNEKRELLLRNHPTTARMDVEKHLVYLGNIDSIITFPTALYELAM